VIGRSGQVARALSRSAHGRGYAVAALGRPEFDLEHPEQLPALMSSYGPDVVINAAAFTAVDMAEEQRETAYRVNAEGAGKVAREASAAGAQVIHLSTDYVFSGLKPTPYVETDATEPLSAYGATKVEGECLVLAADPRAIVVRASWVYDASGKNFVRTMLRLAQSRTEVGVVSDQIGSPTFANDLADAVLTVAASAVKGESPTGVYHCAGAGETSWAGFAEAAFEFSRARGGPFAVVKPISTAEYPTAALRPANSRLDCSKLARDYDVKLPPWRASLEACVDEIAAGGWSLA
jgi:dTDP-4-dehydrorhamnose reductase